MSDRPPIPIDTDDYRSMRVLEEIEKNPNISQRELANSVGVALGIANSLVHALVRKGLVKIRGDNNRSISYHLTKRGLGQKAALAMRWTASTIGFYRETRRGVSEGLVRVVATGARRIVLLGVNEVSEIAIIVAGEAGAEITGIVRHSATYVGDELLGIPVGDVSLLEGADAAVMCLDEEQPGFDEMLRAALAAAPRTSVYTPLGQSLAVPKGSRG